MSCVLQLVSSFQIEAMARQQEGQQAKNKLSSVRKMIAKLLKSINEVRQLLSSLPLLSNKFTRSTTSKCKNKNFQFIKRYKILMNVVILPLLYYIVSMETATFEPYFPVLRAFYTHHLRGIGQCLCNNLYCNMFRHV